MDNILLIYGGESVERDISILTALQVWGYINPDNYRVIPAYIHNGELYTGRARKLRNPKSYTKLTKIGTKLHFCRGGIVKCCLGKRTKIDCALLATHGGSGENGALQGLLEFYNIPYTSCDCYSSRLTMDKYLTIQKATNIGINSPRTVYCRYADGVNYNTISTELGEKVIVKPNTLGSSIGVKIAHNIDELNQAIEVAFTYDNEIIIQEVVENLVELNCAAMTRDGHVIISEIEQPLMAGDMLDFDTKYRANGKMSGLKREFPARIELKLKELIKSTTLKIYREFNLHGVVRIDYLYDSVAHKLYLNEVNSIPGSLAYYLFISDSYNRIDLLTALIESGKARARASDRIVKSFDSSLLDAKPKGGSKS